MVHGGFYSGGVIRVQKRRIHPERVLDRGSKHAVHDESELIVSTQGVVVHPHAESKQRKRSRQVIRVKLQPRRGKQVRAQTLKHVLGVDVTGGGVG